ncbi:hypothetical protein DLAC_10125 [Tieghemostelium lacteum]|uniref:Tlde1 domain-containing protein n=1 Tax=Tieghemostelium lacteum TaxID=361077 RepID=A0A151Z668_TIELA|nr:hypothetical protein DLAC_10125 [Tieghemostelium lacteum]|eukprot:KYQ89456.1 hypothetical protein DLAC_10125 [Tieghemostelium lacteum]
MTWTYSQTTGRISGVFQGKPYTAQGYSGRGIYKNVPEYQYVKNQGPIPQGTYTIGKPHVSVKTGRYVMDLTPNPNNNMFGRSDFQIHGDSILDPGNASNGCIVLSHDARVTIYTSGDLILTVVKG